MGNLMVFGFLFLLLYLYITYTVVKMGSIPRFRDMYSHERRLFIVQYGVLLVALMLIMIGLYRNKQVIDNYEQNGIYMQGEILFKTSEGVGGGFKGYVYRVGITNSDTEEEVRVWSSLSLKIHDSVAIYYLNGSAMIEGEKSSEEGDGMLSGGAILFALATLIYAYRYNIR